MTNPLLNNDPRNDPSSGGPPSSLNDLFERLANPAKAPQQVEIVKVYSNDTTLSTVLISNYVELALTGLAVKSLSKRFGPREFSWWEGVIIAASAARIARFVIPDRRGADEAMKQRATASTKRTAAKLAERFEKSLDKRDKKKGRKSR